MKPIPARPGYLSLFSLHYYSPLLSMFRPTALLNAASKAAAFRSMPTTSRMAPVAYRFYSSAGLSQSDIEVRVLDILKGFDKVDANKVI
jgi:NADH dehydrogenase (ubiquinone) 1 alpha/beta subcomplex 1